jgi:cytochrome c551/c552
MTWGHDGSLYAGETNRGWGSAGTTISGLERLVWTGKMPFEMKTISAKPDGFEIEFTKPVDKKSAEDIDSYTGRSFIYKYHAVYGSPTINNEPIVVKGVKVAEDGRKVHVVVENMRRYYVHEIQAYGIKAADDQGTLLHPTGFYTLNNIPEGPALPASELSTYSSVAEAAAKAAAEKKAAARQKKASAPKVVATAAAPVPTYDEIRPLLEKNTCIACHQVDNRQVGPAFKEIAKRKYSAERMVELIYSPEPANWPGYATPMAPMPQVPRAEALKIATWINSLK